MDRQELRKAALNAELPGRVVAVPEWGDGKYGVKAMSIEESNLFIKSVQNPDGEVDPDRLHVQLLIHSVVDPADGEPLFGQADADTLLHGPRPTELLRVALLLAGLGGDEQLSEAVADLGETPVVETS